MAGLAADDVRWLGAAILPGVYQASQFGQRALSLDLRYGDQDRVLRGALPGTRAAAIFRITPFAPADLDSMLEDRGYKKIDTTLVLHLDLGRCLVPPTEPLHEATIDEWLPIYCRLNDSTLDAHRVHREILEAITGRVWRAGFLRAGGLGGWILWPV